MLFKKAQNIKIYIIQDSSRFICNYIKIDIHISRFVKTKKLEKLTCQDFCLHVKIYIYISCISRIRYTNQNLYI